MQNYPVSLLKRMLETYSPSGSEAELAELLMNELRMNGVHAQVDSAGNLIADLDAQGPRILLCGHMDTVAGMLPVVEREGFLYGRGAVDAKSCLAAMILGSLEASRRGKVPFHVTLAGVVEEETSGKGIESIASRGDQYDLVVFGEPSGTSNIIIGYKGSLRLEITCRSPGGHSSSPWLSPNSLEEAFQFWDSLKKSVLENNAPSKFLSTTGTLVNVTDSPGGNSIPSRATLEIDLRIPPGLEPEDVIRRIEEFRHAYSKGVEGLQFDYLFKNSTPPFLGHQDSEAIRSFRYAIRKTTGEEVQLVRKTGTSDMNVLAQICHTPMIAYGPGDSSLDHTELERVKLSDYLNSIEVYALAIERFASMARPQMTAVSA